MKRIADELYLYEDTCHVYILKRGEKAILIDFGSGEVLGHLHSIGISQVIAILLTHHHRDQAQGLWLANKRGIAIWVPDIEKDLFANVNAHWHARELDKNYNTRQDRFSVLESVSIYGTLKDYQTYQFGDLNITVLPTPGHTTGSISLLTDVGENRIAFTGDLIAGPGEVWSLAATQWTYNGGEGIPFTVLSLLSIRKKKIDMILPSHGTIMKDPTLAIDLLVERLTNLMKLRKQNPRLFQLREQPYEHITENLLKNRTSLANAYVLLSKNKKALFIDFGYDFMAGEAAGFDRASQRPWLYTIDRLKDQYGVEEIDVVIPTHYHDDHVAGFNLLKEVEGTKIWCPGNFADILENPKDYNLPCLWYDSIPVDCEIPLDETFYWEEYEFKLYEQPGHTLYAVAIEFIVDGKKVLAIGDQYEYDHFNYVYQNGFRSKDYRLSAELYRKIAPDLLISGHNEPIEVTEEYLNDIRKMGDELEELHTQLLPLVHHDFAAEGFLAKIVPYQAKVCCGMKKTFEVSVYNPYSSEQEVLIEWVASEHWFMNQKVLINVEGYGHRIVPFHIKIPNGIMVKRARISVDITVGNKRFGQQAEAFVTIRNSQEGYDECI